VIDHIIRPLEDGSGKIQCIKIHGNENSRLLVISAYLPAKGNKNHVIEFHECIDEIYELIFLSIFWTSLLPFSQAL
jgi:hypothetical protein